MGRLVPRVGMTLVQTIVPPVGLLTVRHGRAGTDAPYHNIELHELGLLIGCLSRCCVTFSSPQYDLLTLAIYCISPGLN
jgi:hypothetical protein